MTTYTVDEAATRLPELVSRAASGQEIVLAQSDADVRLVPATRISPGSKPVTSAEIERLRAQRVTPSPPVDITALVREMRDKGL